MSHPCFTAAKILSWEAIDKTQADTKSDPRRETVPGLWCHHRDSVARLIRISVERSMDMSVGCLVRETARVIVQYATIVITAETGSKAAAFMSSRFGFISNLFGRKPREIKERRRLEKPDTNISSEDEMFFLLH